MAQQVTVTAKGLYLAPNDLGEVPDGALAQADNAVISKDGVVEARRGLTSVETVASPKAGRLFAFSGALVIGKSDRTVLHAGTFAEYYSTDGTTWTAWNSSVSVGLLANGAI
jgi:hypothetical protein